MVQAERKHYVDDKNPTEPPTYKKVRLHPNYKCRSGMNAQGYESKLTKCFRERSISRAASSASSSSWAS